MCEAVRLSSGDTVALTHGKWPFWSCIICRFLIYHHSVYHTTVYITLPVIPPYLYQVCKTDNSSTVTPPSWSWATALLDAHMHGALLVHDREFLS